jgi:hypothetical protein
MLLAVDRILCTLATLGLVILAGRTGFDALAAGDAFLLLMALLLLGLAGAMALVTIAERDLEA